MGSSYNPKDEVIVEKCIDGIRTATNYKGFKRQLLDENGNPLRCTK